MSLFDKVMGSEKVKASSVARTKQRSLVTLTVTKSRVTNNFSTQALESAGISIDDLVDITYTKDGKYLMLEVIDGGLKLLTQGSKAKISNASVRLTNKDGAYPDFLGLYDDTDELDIDVENDDRKVVLINDEIEYDNGHRRLICKLKKK